MAPLTAAELEAHPNFGNIKRELQPDQKGRCRVATHRGGPLEIAYEVHGHGRVHIVVSLLAISFENCIPFQWIYFGGSFLSIESITSRSFERFGEWFCGSLSFNH